MKKLLIFSAILLLSGSAFAQNKVHGKADFRLGNGLDIQLNNGDYSFNIGGFIQSDMQYIKPDGAKAENRFGIKYGFFSLGGNAAKEKVSFLLQLDFANNSPLMDAWIAYQPVDFLKITAGQKQTFTNNREMTFFESNLSMNDRSLLSRTLSNTGREFGLFVESKFLIGGVGIEPQAALTSGDGRNSFGGSSIDVDWGGFKSGGRLDILPLGFFAKGNDKIGADIAHETSPKVKIGVAGSYNTGVSNSVGEGHVNTTNIANGDFVLYSKDKKVKLPDYRKVYADVMFKYQGFSLLGEYANTSATRVKGLHFNNATPLAPGDISSLLYLGDSYNIQLGYALKNGFALDLRYTKVKPEFDDAISSMKDMNEYDVTLSKYFIDNRVKIQGGVSYLDYPKSDIAKSLQAELLFQVVF